MSPKHVASSAEDREMVIPAMAADIPPDIFIVADVDDLLAELRRIAAALGRRLEVRMVEAGPAA